MCLPSQRALLCLGSFKDEEDNERKHREDREKEEKPEANMEGLERESRIAEYWIKGRNLNLNQRSINRMTMKMANSKQVERRMLGHSEGYGLEWASFRPLSNRECERCHFVSKVHALSFKSGAKAMALPLSRGVRKPKRGDLLDMSNHQQIRY